MARLVEFIYLLICCLVVLVITLKSCKDDGARERYVVFECLLTVETLVLGAAHNFSPRGIGSRSDFMDLRDNGILPCVHPYCACAFRRAVSAFVRCSELRG